jgi:hypothetical protein
MGETAMPLMTELTTFTRDVLGRYICNTVDEMIVTIEQIFNPIRKLDAKFCL